MSNPKLMKLLGAVLGFELGNENDLNSKMETDSPPSSTKKETNTSKPTTTTNEQNKNSKPELSPVINLIFFDWFFF